MTDFWPEGISLEDTQSPKDILVGADQQWREKSGGVLSLIIRETTSEGDNALLIVHVMHEPTNRTVNLFSVVYRPMSPYPAAIQPMKGDLPDFLKKSYYRPGIGGFGSIWRVASEGGTVKNEWVAYSPNEFRDLLKAVFNLGTVKADLLSLLAGGGEGPDEPGDDELEATDQSAANEQDEP